MPNGSLIAGRVEPDLYEAARRATGLPEDVAQGRVIRFALAALAGRDPVAVSGPRRGRKKPRILGPGRNT